MKDKVNKLYHPLIIQHNKQPVSYGKQENAAIVLEANNPLCGDRFKLYFEIENGIIKDLGFHGFGCAVSKASASVMVSKLNLQMIQESKRSVNSFLEMFEKQKELKSVLIDDEFIPFQAARDFPGRIKCATLVWEEMYQYLLKI